MIPNGVDVDSFRTTGRKTRVCADARPHLSGKRLSTSVIDAASQARTPVWIGGEVFGYEAHQRYFRDQIEPRLQYTNHRFLGPLNSVRKRRLLAAARCLLVPSLAPETSSLVAMEALASGTPVIAFRSGALTDIVEHGVTGYLVENGCEMAEAIAHIERSIPRACRKAAEQRFPL